MMNALAFLLAVWCTILRGEMSALGLPAPDCSIEVSPASSEDADENMGTTNAMQLERLQVTDLAFSTI